MPASDYRQSKQLLRCMFVATVVVIMCLLFMVKYQVGNYLVAPAQVVAPKEIFFIETKFGKHHMSLREACVVEAAALHNPKAQITMFNINEGGHNTSHQNVETILKNYSNVKFSELNKTGAFSQTPLDSWFKKSRILESLYPVEHMSDALRLVLLWKMGGVYMDTDSLVISSLESLENTIGLESEYVANGVMAFEVASEFIYKCMLKFSDVWNGGDWGAQGPSLVTDVLKQVCGISSLKYVVNKPDYCEGIEILPRHVFYPIKWMEWWRLFQIADDFNNNFSDSLTVHLFGSNSRNQVAKVGGSTILEKLFQQHCPFIFQLMSQQQFI